MLEINTILDYTNERIKANMAHIKDYGDADFMNGAIQALKELCVELEIVKDYRYFE